MGFRSKPVLFFGTPLLFSLLSAPLLCSGCIAANGAPTVR